jgi:hypothetical protein
MVSEKAVYWVAVVVAVFGFSHTRFARHFDLTSSITDRFACVADKITGSADRLLSRAELPMELGEVRINRSQAKLARAQQKVACVQATMARRQADFARLEANRARLMAMEQMHRVTFVNPMQNVVIRVPQMSIPNLPKLTDDGTL